MHSYEPFQGPKAFSACAETPAGLLFRMRSQREHVAAIAFHVLQRVVIASLWLLCGEVVSTGSSMPSPQSHHVSFSPPFPTSELYRRDYRYRFEHVMRLGILEAQFWPDGRVGLTVGCDGLVALSFLVSRL